MFNSTQPPANTDDTLTELIRFFTVVADGTQTCPMFSSYIDQVWHALLSTPESYAQFSRKACGQVIDHQASQGDGQIPWISDYEARYGKLPSLWFADAIGTVDKTAYAAYCTTGKAFRSWDCTATTNDDDD